MIIVFEGGTMPEPMFLQMYGTMKAGMGIIDPVCCAGN